MNQPRQSIKPPKEARVPITVFVVLVLLLIAGFFIAQVATN